MSFITGMTVKENRPMNKNCDGCELTDTETRARVVVNFTVTKIDSPRQWKVCHECLDNLRDDEENGQIKIGKVHRIMFSEFSA